MMHGILYHREYGYGIEFEAYVAKGLYEFYKNYDPKKDRVWIAEEEGKIAGCLFLMHREDGEAQLRFFLLEPAYRGIGLGKELATLFMAFLKDRGYRRAHLWTTHELHAAAALYGQMGFTLTEELGSTAFGKPLKEQRYDLIVRD
ncbi:MAG: GNAT family N-acetyltransferase [Bacteroidota bacterium]|nr:GNAT family N-acetyltransferase [Bacteroidota bacterium]